MIKYCLPAFVSLLFSKSCRTWMISKQLGVWRAGLELKQTDKKSGSSKRKREGGKMGEAMKQGETRLTH